MADISTAIKQAKVFRDGAELTRYGTATLSEGTQTIRVLGLGRTSQTDRVTLYGREGVTCSNIRFETATEDTDEKIRKINEEIKALERKVNIRQVQAKLWESNGDFSARTVQDSEDIRKYIDKLSERFDALDAEILSLNRQIEDKKKEIEDLKTESAKPVLIADVTAEKRGEYPIALKVFDSYAGWFPLYEIRSDGEGPLTLQVKANISQGTDEDWDDVEVRLITGSPTNQGTLPVLNPIHLDINPPIYMNSMLGAGSAMRKTAARGMMEDSVALEMEEASPMMGMSRMKAGSSTVNKDEAYTEYVLTGKRTVKKGHDGTLADLEVHEIPCEYSIVCIPKLDPSAYLVAKVKPADLPIFSFVSASVYYKDVFTGNVTIDAEFAEEDIDITLGTEERITVNRKEVTRKNTTNLLKTQKTTEYGYETRINNNSSGKVTVTIKDQIPVSDEKEIVVETLELSEGELNKDTGIITRKYDIEGGESAIFKLGYKVTSPKGKSVYER